jgi:glutamate racemase
MVALAEEGWTRGLIADAIVRRYLDSIARKAEGFQPQSIILGCTHFPLLYHAVRDVVGGEVAITDSASTTAVTVENTLLASGLLAPVGESGSLKLLATDGAHRFARVGGMFLGNALAADDIELIDL